MMLVQDTQCNGAAASVSGTNSSVFTNVANLARAFRNPYTYNRFKILATKRISLFAPWSNDAAGSEQQAQVSKDFTMIWKARGRTGIPIDYTSTTGALTERISNNIFLVASVNSDGADDKIAAAANTFVNFYDM